MKQVYLSASWSRREEVRKVAEDLEGLADIYVKCDWLWVNDPNEREAAYRDVRDLRDCDVFVRFSDDLSKETVPSHLATGGRMFETGLAYGLGKEMYIVGDRQNVFDHLPRVRKLASKEELFLELCPRLQ